MYKGYRIKINGNIVSNDIVSQGSYSAQRERRVLEEFYTADGVRHEKLSKRVTMKISFSIRERSMKEQENIENIFQQNEKVEVEYWDDIAREYRNGIFKIERPIFKHRNTRNNTISYDKTSIVLKEY